MSKKNYAGNIYYSRCQKSENRIIERIDNRSANGVSNTEYFNTNNRLSDTKEDGTRVWSF